MQEKSPHNYNFLCNMGSMARKSIREAIRDVFDFLKDKGEINQTQLAKMIDRTPQAVSKYLSGDTEMGEEIILSFCRALGLRWQDLDVDTGVKRDDRIDQWVKDNYYKIIEGRK